MDLISNNVSTSPADVPSKADVVVVGSGLAGLAVAGELAVQGVRNAIVLESGPDLGHEHYRWELDEETALRQWLEPDSDKSFWRPYTTSGRSYLGISGLRRRVGGRSLYWHGVALPIEPWALDDAAWPKPVVADLVTGWNGGASLYDRVSEDLARWVGGGSGLFPQSGQGITFGDYAFTPTPQAVRTAPDTRRWAAFLPLNWCDVRDGGAQGSASVPIFADCHVLGVKLRGGTAVGVRARRGSDVIDVDAPQVVLAAGTIENSRLAMQALTDAGCLAEPRLRGLVDKIVHGFAVTFEAADLPADLVDTARAGAFCYLPAEDRLRSNHFLILYINKLGAVVLDTWLIGEQVPGDAGHVLGDPSAGWPWSTRVVASLGQEDERLCVWQQQELDRLWNQVSDTFGTSGSTLTFDRVYGSPDLPDRLLAARAAHGRTAVRTYSFPLGSEQHEAGTTPLGTLLDNSHEFFQVPGLFAAGPSSFPRTGAANPSLTTLALARRLAGKLAGTPSP